MWLLPSLVSKQRSSKKVEGALTSCIVCRCHVLQLDSVQAANATPGIKHIYTTLMTLRKFFHYSPKRAVIKGDSESTRSSRAQGCETVRHMLACT